MTEKIQDVLVKIEAENKPYNRPDQDLYKKLVLNSFIDKAYPEIICWILTCICIEEKEIFDFEITPAPDSSCLYIKHHISMAAINRYSMYETFIFPIEADQAKHDHIFRQSLANSIAQSLGIKINDKKDFAAILANYKNYNYASYCLFAEKYNG